jgi:hypothetical protein
MTELVLHGHQLQLNQNNGAPKLFLQGMGGPSIGIKIPDETINQLKELYQNDKALLLVLKSEYIQILQIGIIIC